MPEIPKEECFEVRENEELQQRQPPETLETAFETVGTMEYAVLYDGLDNDILEAVARYEEEAERRREINKRAYDCRYMTGVVHNVIDKALRKAQSIAKEKERTERFFRVIIGRILNHIFALNHISICEESADKKRNAPMKKDEEIPEKNQNYN